MSITSLIVESRAEELKAENSKILPQLQPLEIQYIEWGGLEALYLEPISTHYNCIADGWMYSSNDMPSFGELFSSTSRDSVRDVTRECVCVCGLRKSKQTLLGGGIFLCVWVAECRLGKNKQTDFLSQRTHLKYTILEDTQCLPIFKCVKYTILEGYTISAQYLHNFEALRGAPRRLE